MEVEPSTSTGVRSRLTRKRKRPPSPTVIESVRVPWKKEEKLKLFEAVKIHGHKDLDELSKAVDTKTQRQIASYLRGRENEVKIKVRSKDKSTFDLWLDTTRQITDKKKDYSQILHKAISVITQNETPNKTKNDNQAQKKTGDKQKKEAEQPNVDAIYKYLIAGITGKNFSELNLQNTKVLSDLCTMLTNIVREVRPELEKEIEFMSRWSKKTARNDSSNDQRENGENAEALFSLNPFNIPSSMLKEVHDKVISSFSYEKNIDEFVQMYTNAANA